MRREKKQNIPSTEDIKRLSLYLDRERKFYFTELKTNYTYNNWVKLSKLVMASIIVFNRRRTGETQNILMSDFFNSESINENSNLEIFATLTDKAKEVVKKYSRMKIRGKKGRTVPVLLKPGIDECVELLIRYRTAGISPLNEYLLALPTISENRARVIDACHLLRKFSVMCGAEDPKSLRGTNMRKHIASMCIGMELNDTVVAEVAEFMGHHEEVQREYYRHNTLDRQVVKMSQLLETAQGHGNDNEDDNDDEIENDDDDFDGDCSTKGVDMPLDVSSDFADIDSQPSNSDKCETPNPNKATPSLKRKMPSNESGVDTTHEDEYIPQSKLA